MTHRYLIYMLLAPALLLAADDPGGWSKAKWGMTTAEILQAFGTENIRINTPQKPEDAARLALPAPIAKAMARAAEEEAKSGQSTLSLVGPLDLAGVKFGALMRLNRDGHLESVSLTPEGMADHTDGLFRNLEELLVQKYGRPWKTTEEKNLTEDQWSFKTTIVTLSRQRFPLITELVGENGPGSRFIRIEYKSRPADLDKL